MPQIASERTKPTAGATTRHDGDRPEASFDPPKGLLSRVRWVFLLFSVLMAVLAISLILQANATPWGLQASAIAGLLWLVSWWILGYRRGRFPIVFCPLEGSVIFVAALATGTPPTALGLIYSSIMFRSLYGSLRSVVVLLILYLAAFSGAVVIAARFAYLGLPLTLGLPEALGLPLVAVMFHVLATTVAGRERAMSRERTLRESAATLVAALDRKGVYAAALEGAQELARDVPRTRVCLAVGPPEKMVVTAAGDGAGEAEGAEVNLHDLPETIRATLLRRRPVDLDQADPETLPVVRKALSFEPKTGSVYHVPLLVRDEFGGLLAVSSDSVLPQELKDSLVTLGSQVALALESIALTEELYRRRNEERLHSLLQNTSDLLTVIDVEGRVIYESPSAERVLGYKPEELVGESGFRRIHPDDLVRVQEIFAAVASRPGPTRPVELRVRHRDGSWRVFESVGNNLLHDPDLRGIVINSRDVTERKRAETKLQVSEANLAEAQRIARLGSWEYEREENRVYWSDETYRIFGFEPRRLVPTLQDFFDRVHPEDRALVREDMEKLTRGERTQESIEFRVVRTDGGTRFVQGRRHAELDETGAPVKVAGTIQDVTGRRRAEEQLKASEAELRALFGAMNDLIAVFDGEGRCLKVAPTSRSLMYRPPEEMLGKTFHEMFPKGQADAFREGVRIALETREPNTIEYSMRAGNRRGWFEVTLSPMLEDTVLAVARDVTARKESEQALRESEASLAAAQRIAHLGSWDSGPLEEGVPWERRGMIWSDETYRLLGFAPGEITPSFRALVEATHPDDMERVGRLMREATFRREPSIELEHRILRRDGEVRVVQAQIETVYGETGQPARRFGTMLDVTERKRVEDELRRRESELAAAQRIAQVGNWTIELDEDEIRWSDEMYRIFGYAPQELAVTYKRFVRMVHAGDRSHVQRSIREVVYGDGRRHSLDYRLVRPDGEVRFLHSQYEAVLGEGGRRIRLVGTSQDVTERKRAEEALQQSEERYRAVVEQAGEGIFLFDPATKRVLEANLAFRRMLGYGAGGLEGLTVYDLAPHDPEGVEQNVERTLERGHVMVGERRYRRGDGSLVEVEVSGSAISYGGEEVVCSVIRDVTGRKRAEEALRTSEARFRSMVEQAPLSIQILSPDGRTLRVNRAWEELFGLTVEDIAGYNVLQDQQLVDKGAMPYILRGFAGETTEIPPIPYVPDETIPGASDHGGQERWVQAFIYPVKDASGDVQEVVLMHEDVSERKRAEEALKESEERYRAVVEQAAEGIVLVDVQTKRILETNAVYEHLLGYSSEEMRVLTLYDIVPYSPEDMGCYVEKVLEQRIYVSGERRHLRRDGSEIDVEVSASVISYGGREALCVVVRDITGRKRSEEALREAREAERRRIARDMHDRVLSDLVYALSEIQIRQELYGQADDLEDAAEAMRRSVEGLRAAIFEMRLEETLERSIASSLEALVEVNRRMSRGRYGVELVLGEGAAEAVPETTGRELVRIIQEAMNNARRHSGARNIRVALRTGGGRVLAEVSDDGRGFDPRSSVGGVGMSSMRGRAEALGGELEVESEPGRGTTVRFRAPLPG